MTPEEQIVMAVLQCRRSDLYCGELKITQDQARTIDAWKERFNNGEPLQYILGETEFLGTRIKVDQRVLIPRPETELMVDFSMTVFPKGSFDNMRILDVCTGSGCIAIALAQKYPGSCVDAVDCSHDALELAKENAALNGVSDSIVFYAQDAVEYLRCCQPGTYDMVITNPPYIPSGAIDTLPMDVRQEPCQALDGGEDGLVILKQVIAHVAGCLKPKGVFLTEFGDGQESALAQCFDSTWFVEWMNDLSQMPRFCVARRKDTRS